MVTQEEIRARIAALKNRVSRIRTVKYGDYVLSSDFNEVASCLAEAADILSKLPLTKEIIKVGITEIGALPLRGALRFSGPYYTSGRNDYMAVEQLTLNIGEGKTFMSMEQPPPGVGEGIMRPVFIGWGDRMEVIVMVPS
ncbi:MAG: hypothetical protein QW734_07675 [Candidatus Bathyarchaeia archaeon]